ncbi:glycosyltransferase family 4 protein [Acidobacteria bacterium AH-259-D05]|nr:glycosyltransferase family 4 protein [Acidobacteria bacterium AH-259-D05]
MKSHPLHILLLNQYFPPDTSATAQMAALVAETLAQRHRVTVLAGRPSYAPDEYHPYYLWRREKRGNLTVERVGSSAYPRHQMRGRFANYLSYLALAVPRALMIKADLVLSMTDPPPMGIAAALVAWLKRRPFVYNIRDLHPDMAVASGFVPSGPWVNIWESLHRWALRQAAQIVVLGEDMRERVIAKGVDRAHVVVVRDGVPQQPAMTLPDHPVIQEIRCGFRFVVLHAGNLGYYGAWETLIEASKLLDGEGIGLVFVGAGAAQGKVETLSQGCQHVRLLPFRAPDEVPYMLAAADVHVVTIRRGLEGVVVPSKLYSILGAGRPVLALASESSDVARIVRSNGCGVVADPDDPVLTAATLRALANDPVRLKQMAGRARAVAPEFDQLAQLARFVPIVEQVCVTGN